MPNLMRQSTAKELAERITKKSCKLKHIRSARNPAIGRYVIFVGRETTSDIYGDSWYEAIVKLFDTFHVEESVRQTLSIGHAGQMGSDPSKPADGLPVVAQQS